MVVTNVLAVSADPDKHHEGAPGQGAGEQRASAGGGASRAGGLPAPDRGALQPAGAAQQTVPASAARLRRPARAERGHGARVARALPRALRVERLAPAAAAVARGAPRLARLAVRVQTGNPAASHSQTIVVGQGTAAIEYISSEFVHSSSQVLVFSVLNDKTEKVVFIFCYNLCDVT